MQTIEETNEYHPFTESSTITNSVYLDTGFRLKESDIKVVENEKFKVGKKKGKH